MPKIPAPVPFYQTDDELATVYLGDCRKVLPRLERSFSFAFADPPFGIGHPYREFKDHWETEEAYERFTEEWIREVWQCSSVVALHGNDTLADIYLRTAHCFGMPRVAWINWHYRFGVCQRTNWIDARCHCLVYAWMGRYTWNPDSVLVESDRVGYGDKRVHETEKGGKRVPGTVWGVPSDGPYWGRVQGNNEERCKGAPNQLPEVYLARLIRAYTSPGDLLLDPFGGSGTTAVVARALGRRVVTIDVSRETCYAIVERLKRGAARIPEGRTIERRAEPP